MKRTPHIIIAVLIVFSLCACGMIKENIEIFYGETYSIENEKLNKYDELAWETDNESIAAVESGNIIAMAPGTATVKANSGDKTIAEFNVSVKTIPISSIVLSTNSSEIVDGDSLQLSYSLFPENASDYGLKWRSADETVATVDDSGLIKALKPGQTNISVSNSDGIIATCSITVKLKPAYDRLSPDEKAFVDCCLNNIDDFKNPDSVVIKEIEKNGVGKWIVKVSAQNGFGGNNTNVYYLGNTGFWNWKSLLDTDLDISIKADNSFNISLINEAMAEKR